ncbi:hypothetical protein [Microbacterium oryzae]|uniref:hypothetical protein n=1 Tax=Microbacterium oryzae TaxID=743009 RepID=UPI0012E1A431|nr:hypothetical protein [Microbacterium oryzae]
MDPTLAALAGAIVGAVATALVPLMTIRAQRRDAATEQRRSDTLGLLDALIRLLKARSIGDWQGAMHTHSEAVVALERLMLSAPRRDVEYLQSVTQFALESINDRTHPLMSAAGVEAMSQVLRRWCRGELNGVRIADAYGPALEAQLDLHERDPKQTTAD